MRILLAIGLCLAVQPLPAQQQSAFISVSIKPNSDPPNVSGTHQITPGRVHFVHVALKRLLTDAFRIQDYQLISSASLTTGRWDVEATMPSDSSPEQVPAMLRTMLTERFGLQTHAESRPQSVYVLTSVTPGRLQPTSDQSGRLSLEGTATTFKINGRGDMAGLVSLLRENFDLPVLDATGLDRRYQISIEYSRDVAMESAAGSADVAAPSLFTVLKDQLGLRLERKKEPIECVVVDHVSLTASPN